MVRLPLSGNTCRHPGLSRHYDILVLCLRLTVSAQLCTTPVVLTIVVRIDATSPGAIEGGSEAMLSSFSVSRALAEEEEDEEAKAPFFIFFTYWQTRDRSTICRVYPVHAVLAPMH